MALGTGHVTTTTSAVFIPELWSDDVIAAYKKNLVLANHVTKINHKGKKGDSIHIPKPSRGVASAKAASTQVSLQAATETELVLNINKHYEYSRLIEDIVAVQALPSMRKFYTDDAGYALAIQVDNDLHGLGAGLNGGSAYSGAVIGGDGETTWSGAANTNTGNGSKLTDVGIRNMMQKLDDQDVPFSDRVFIVPPVEKNTLLGIDRFVTWSQVGEAGGSNSIRNGKIGDLYGTEVFVSTNCPTVNAADGVTAYRAGLYIHKEAFAFIEQMSVRSQTQYKQEYLGDLFTADTIYGIGELRDTSGVAFIVPK